jgi:hypothetical protein
MSIPSNLEPSVWLKVSVNIGVATMMLYRPILMACLVAFAGNLMGLIADAQEAATEEPRAQIRTMPVVSTGDVEITSPAPGQVVGVHTGTLHIQVKVLGALEDDETSVTAKAIGDNQIDYGSSPLSRIGSTNYFGGPIQVPASAEGMGFRIRADAVFAVGEPGHDVEFDYTGIDLDAPPPDEAIAAVKAPTAEIQNDCYSDRIVITRPLKREKVHVNAEGGIFVQLKALDPVKPASKVFAQAMTYDDDDDETYEKSILHWNEDLNLYEGWIEAPHDNTDEGARFLIKGEVDFRDDGKPYRCTYHGPIFGLDK